METSYEPLVWAAVVCTSASAIARPRPEPPFTRSRTESVCQNRPDVRRLRRIRSWTDVGDIHDDVAGWPKPPMRTSPSVWTTAVRMGLASAVAELVVVARASGSSATAVSTRVSSRSARSECEPVVHP